VFERLGTVILLSGRKVSTMGDFLSEQARTEKVGQLKLYFEERSTSKVREASRDSKMGCDGIDPRISCLVEGYAKCRCEGCLEAASQRPYLEPYIDVVKEARAI
jgi:hypothetical protein